MTKKSFPDTHEMASTSSSGSEVESASSNDSVEVNDIKDNFFFDENGELRVFFNFILLLIFHVIVSTTIMFVLGILFPNYFGLGMRTLVLIGLISLFFAYRNRKKM